MKKKTKTTNNTFSEYFRFQWKINPRAFTSTRTCMHPHKCTPTHPHTHTYINTCKVLISTQISFFNKVFEGSRGVRTSSWCNGCRRKKLNQLSEFKSWTKLFAFPIQLIALGKAWIQLFSHLLFVNSKTFFNRVTASSQEERKHRNQTNFRPGEGWASRLFLIRNVRSEWRWIRWLHYLLGNKSNTPKSVFWVW